MIFLIPVLIASLVSISRIVDYRHHWDDVLVGSLIGCASAATGYFYFYNLLIENSDQIKILASSNELRNNIV